MVIITQKGLVTPSHPWWSVVRINSENKREVLLQRIEGKEVVNELLIARMKSNKAAMELYKAILEANNYDAKVFNAKTWVKNYSSESSKSAEKTL